MRNLKIFLIIVGFSFLLIQPSHARTITIKFATLAPNGSTWMKVMNGFKQAVADSTDGEVQFKIYAGGVQGDEKDVLRKIRFKQLHSAGFTGVGLGEILPEVRILDAPFLFRNHDEVDYVTRNFFDRFARAFEEKGFVLLGWVEVGFVYVYTDTPVRTPADFKGVKMWMWEGDPLAEATFEAFGISPIPLSVTDVLTSLQTGLINGVYTSPMACVALQWFTKVDYVLDVPLSNSNGAVLVDKRTFNRISEEHQKTVKRLGREYFSRLTRLGREDNKASMQQMINNGLQKVTVQDTSVLRRFEKIGARARRELVGKLYDAELLNTIEQTVQTYRNEHE